MSAGLINQKPKGEKMCDGEDLGTKRKAKRKLVIEVERVRTVCRRSPIYLTRCAGCGTEVELVTFDDAAKIIGTSRQAIIKFAAGGEIHIGIVPEALLVCLNSLLDVAAFSRNVKAH